MHHFEYLVRSNLRDMAEVMARRFGSKECVRLNTCTQVVASELNRLGPEGWGLVKAPDAATNRNRVFKRHRA